MRRIFGFFVLILALAWPGVGFGQEYTFGKNGDAHNAQSGASAGSGGKIGFCLAPRFLDSLANTGNIDGSGGRAFCNTLEQINFETLYSELTAKMNFAYSSCALPMLALSAVRAFSK